jgi:hypothetical protein
VSEGYIELKQREYEEKQTIKLEEVYNIVKVIVGVV